MLPRNSILGIAALLATLLLAGPGCQNTPPNPSLVSTAQTFRQLRDEGRYDEARAMMSGDPRRWFGAVEGEGSAWSIVPGTGPWSVWDTHFRSQSEQIGWVGDPHARTATLTLRETNEYYQMLERGWSTLGLTYLFDDALLIRGLLIHALDDDPDDDMGRTDEFLAWARANDPDELAYLRPGGDIDPTGDRPQRHRALLIRWRLSVGLAEMLLR